MRYRATLQLLVIQLFLFSAALSGYGQSPCAASPPSIRSSTGYFTLCGNTPLLLNSSSPTGNVWLQNEAPLDSSNASLVVTQSGSYRLVVTDPSGCRDSSATVNITSEPGPAAPQLTADGPTEICPGGSVGLFCSSDVGNQWFDNNVAMPGITGNECLATAAGRYWVQVTDPQGCWALSNAISVSINPTGSGDKVAPSVSPGGPLTFCGDTVVWLVSTPAIGFQWFDSGYAIPGANSDSLLVTQSGSYSVATGTTACGSQGGMSAVVAINFLGGTVPAITMRNGILYSNADSGNQWYRDAQIIRGATHPQFTPQEPGSYTVQVEFGVQAVDTSTFQIGVGGCYSRFSLPYVVTDSLLATPQVLAYPNPASTTLTLVNKRPGPVTLRVFDMMGRVRHQVQGVTGSIFLDVATWAKGIYIVQTVDQATQQTDKIVFIKM